MRRLLSSANRAALLFAVTVALAVGGAALVSCDAGSSETNGTSVTELADARGVLSEELMVALAQAKNFHHKADVHLRDAQLDLAIDSITQILSIPFPPGAAEATDVILDARARLAKLLVTRGDLEAAMKVADEGLDESKRASFFLANLYTVRGHVWEARALKADEAAGEGGKGGKEAKAARRQAIADFDRSIAINNAVLSRLAQEAK